MKKIILTTAIALSVVFGISSSSFAATVKIADVSTVLSNVSKINEIEIHGNVQVYLTSDNEDKVKVYNNYYADNALVQEQNGVLKITSYSTEKLVVWVTVSNLAKLSVFDDAEVRSFGKFSAIDVDVNLHNNAVAQLGLDGFNVSFTLTDRAQAKLSGHIENGSLQYSHWSHLDITSFTAASLTKTLIAHPVRHFHADDLASL